MSFRAVGLWRPIPRLLEIVVSGVASDSASDFAKASTDKKAPTDKKAMPDKQDDGKTGFPI